MLQVVQCMKTVFFEKQGRLMLEMFQSLDVCNENYKGFGILDYFNTVDTVAS